MLPLSFYLCSVSVDYDQDKLTLIYEQFLDAMLFTAKKYVGSYQAEEDVVHDAVLKIIDNLNKVDLSNTAQSKNYVCIIAKSCAIDWLRNHKYDNTLENIDAVDVETASDGPSPLEQVLSKDGYEKLVNGIRSLNDTYRTVCELKFIHDLKERDIAELLGISPKNVSVRIARGRKILMELLKEDCGND